MKARILDILATVIACVIAASIASHLTRQEWQIEAVQHGAAYWNVHSDGSTDFRWNTGALAGATNLAVHMASAPGGEERRASPMTRQVLSVPVEKVQCVRVLLETNGVRFIPPQRIKLLSSYPTQEEVEK